MSVLLVPLVVLLVLMLLASTVDPLLEIFTGVVGITDDWEVLLLLLGVDALLLFSVRISTLKRTLRAMNFSGDRYSQRNRLGLFML